MKNIIDKIAGLNAICILFMHQFYFDEMFFENL